MNNQTALRIGIDGYNLALPQGTGVATYGRVLGRAVNEMGFPVDLLFGLDVSKTTPVEFREALFFSRLANNPGLGQKPRTLRAKIKRLWTLPGSRAPVEVEVRGHVTAPELLERLPPFERLFSYPDLFSLSIRYYRIYRRFLTVRMADPPDIMHWTYPLPIRLRGAKNIYTLHDLVPLRFPHTTLEDKAYYQRLIADCLRVGDRICTVSEASRNDILKLFNVSPEKVVNTYQSTEFSNDEIENSEDIKDLLRRIFELNYKEYLLFFAAIEPKKNLGRLIEAYIASDVRMPFIVVGKEAWKANEELRLLQGAHGVTLSAAHNIRRIEYLPRHLLRLLIKGARAVCFPSIYEGFGLPALEAMSLGTPALLSKSGSLPEIGGEGALMVDPYSVSDIANALKRLDQDDDLCMKLSELGKIQAKLFSASNYKARLKMLYGPYLNC